MENISRQPAEDMRIFNAEAVKRAIEANQPDLCVNPDMGERTAKAMDTDAELKEFADHISSLMIREIDPARLNDVVEGIRVKLFNHFETKFKEAEKQRAYYCDLLVQFGVRLEREG